MELGALVAGFDNPNYQLLEGWDTTNSLADTAFTQDAEEVNTADAQSPLDSPIPINTTLPAALDLTSPYNYRRTATSTPLGGTTILFGVAKEAEEVDTAQL